MDTGRLERPSASYGSSPYASPQGMGVRYMYFDPETGLDEILLITHSVTLLSMSRAVRLPRPLPLIDRTALIFSLVKNQSPHTGSPLSQRGWLPIPEQLGMYLVMRLASRSAWVYFTSW